MKLLLFNLLALLFLMAGAEALAQNYIGMHKDEIIETVKASDKSLKLNTSTVNPHYNYLKFEDRINEITVLFFLSEEDKCTLVRKMYDYSNINDVLVQLNSSYKKAGNNAWYYADKGTKYTIVLTEGDWFFTVTIKPDEE